MSNLLTRQEYSAIAEAVDYPRSPFIDGRYRPGNGPPLKSTNPATGEVVCEIAACNAEDVEFAVSRAREAFDEGRWSKQHPAARKDVLIRLCKLMTRGRRELAVMESVESGKPIRDCETIDVPEAINTIKWHAEAIDKIYDQVAPGGDDALALVVREPVGVVGLVPALEFPAVDAGLEDRPCPCGRQLGHRQAGRTDQHHRVARSRTGHGGRYSAWRSAGFTRRWPDGRQTARSAQWRRHGELHRLDRNRAALSALRRR